MPVLSVTHGLGSEVGARYAARYASIDPRRELAIKLAVGDSMNSAIESPG